MVKAVIFDLGDTLISVGKINPLKPFTQGAKLTYEYLRRLGLPVGSFCTYFCRNLLAIRIRSYLSAISGKDFDSSAFLKKYSVKRGIQLDNEQWRQLSWLWYEPLCKVSKIEPDIKETLAKLRNAGLKLGILSNTFISSDSIDRQLSQLGILDFFPVRLFSYEFDFRKPDLRIFKAAAERIGEPLENIVYVGDRINKDAEPVLKLGMTSVIKTAYTNAGKNIPPGAYKIDNLAELPDLIKKINS